MSPVVGDFLAVGQLTLVLYHDCLAIAGGAPQEFELLVQQLKTLHTTMNSFDKEFKNPQSVLVRSGEDHQQMIGEILAKVNETLNKMTDIFRKHRNLGNTARSGVKRTWDKFKWKWDAKDVDGLRSKLSYHNGVLGLVLTCAGTSQIQTRTVEITTRFIDDGRQQVNTHLRPTTTGLGNTGLHPTSTDSVASASTLDNSARVKFSAVCMKAAEVSQRWMAIGIADWIKAGRWWWLRAHAELQNTSTGSNGENVVSKECYLNLLKASWILTDVIALHPQFGLINPGIHQEVMQLTRAINQQFTRLAELDANLPPLSEVNEVVIWEGHTQSPTPKVNSQGNGTEGGNWIMEGEVILYQSFGNYHPHDHTAPIVVCISVVVNLDSNQARLVYLDQSWRILVNIQLTNLSLDAHINRVVVENNTISVSQQKVIVPTTIDVVVLHATLLLYEKYHAILTGLPDPVTLYHDALIFMIALKLMSVIEDPTLPRRLAQRELHRQRHLNNNRTHPFLRQFDIIATRLSLETPGSKASLAVSETPTVTAKGGKFDEYAYSLLGWVLYQHYELGIEWVQLCVPTPILDTDPWEHLLHPRTACAQGNIRFLKLWLAGGLDPKKETDLILSAIDTVTPMIIHLFHDHGASMNDWVGTTGMKILHYAVHQGQEAAVIMLLGLGATIEALDDNQLTPLGYAARDGRGELVRLLLDHGAQIECQDKDQWTPLHLAAKGGHEGAVRLLLDRGAQIECQDKDKCTPLHLVVQEGHESVVRLLLDRRAQIECVDKGKWTPLHYAAKGGCRFENIVRLLLDHGAQVECQDKDQLTPLHLAAKGGHEGVVRLLLDRGAQIECQDKDKCNPLHFAAEGGFDVVRLLLDHGAQLECQNKDKCTPLHLASKGGLENIVRLLLDRGAQIECQDKDECTPLHLAVKGGLENIVRLLLDLGAQIECLDNGQCTPLFTAAIGGHEDVVMLLLDRGAEIQGEDKHKCKLLHAAVKGRLEDVIILLLDRGAQIECQDEDISTALHLAARGGLHSIVRLLLNRGAQIEAHDRYERTPLHWAAREGFENVVGLLLDRGAQIDCPAQGRRTPLEFGAYEGHEGVVRVLLNRGADVNTQDTWNWAPLHSAAHGGHVDVVRLLLDHGAALDILNESYHTPLQTARDAGKLHVIKLLEEHIGQSVGECP